MSGILLLLLGIWGAFSPLVGPYFGYAFGQDDAWNPSTDMLWLSFLPAAAVVIGALILMTSSNRASGGIGAWLALAGGLWFVVGPASGILWDGGGPDAPIGRPLGDEGLRVAELLWSFYEMGAAFVGIWGPPAIAACTDRRDRVTDVKPTDTRAGLPKIGDGREWPRSLGCCYAARANPSPRGGPGTGRSARTRGLQPCRREQRGERHARARRLMGPSGP